MICASSRGNDERRPSVSGGQQHHHSQKGSSAASQQHHRQHNHQQQQQVKRLRKKGEEEKEEQIRKRKQKQTAGRRGKGGGGGRTVGKGQEESPKEEVKKKEEREAEEARKKWEEWERRVAGGVVGVEEGLRKSITRAEKFETLYDAEQKPIATGMFTNIRRCRSKASRKEYAAKFSQRNRYGTDCTTEIYHEVALLSIVAPCPQVVHLCDVFETPQEIILVLEYAPGGDLQSIIDENMVPFESDVVEFVRSLLEGLIYIHEKHIAHLDIKPQNLVMMGAFPDCNIKLCDFEISRVILQGESIREILGTPDYVAPEILHYEPISTSADMWSLGVTTYVLLTGFSPFGGDTDQETFCNISKAELDFPDELFEDVSDNAKDFISRLLVRDPSSRPTASNCLNHPWISQHTNRTLGHAARFLSVSAAPSPAASCKDFTVLRKHLSKSREALFERVAGSNLRKALSRSRDRLCGSHLSLVTRSRDALHDMPSTAARRRSRDELFTLLSRSHETLGLRECTDKKPGSNVEMWPLQGLQGLTSGNKNVSSVMEDVTTAAKDGQGFEGEGTGEDSDSEGTVRDWKEEAWTTAAADSAPAKICDSDGESDKGKMTENEAASSQKEKAEFMEADKDKCENLLERDNEHVNMIIIEKKENRSDEKLEISNNKDEMFTESNGMQSPEQEEPRYTVAQLISVFNRRWESQQQMLGSVGPPITNEILFGMERHSKNIPFKEDKEQGSENNREGNTNNSRGGNTDAEVSVRPASEYLRSGSLSSETSGYDTPSDVSSMASWEEGSIKVAKQMHAENEEELGNKGNFVSERRSSMQGVLAHHTWGMKVCDGSYNRAMEKFGNTEHRGRACKSVGEQPLEKSHRKCKSFVRPFL